MAYENTHLYLADRIYREIGEDRIHRIIERNEDEYRLGAIFPDILFYSKNKRVADMAYALHGDDGLPTNRLIFAILEKAQLSEDDRDLAFVFGYITHCAVDIILHPVVYYLSGFQPDANHKESQRSAYIHWHLETLIDQRINKRFYLQETVNPNALRRLFVLSFMDVEEKAFLKALNRQLRYFKMIANRKMYRVFRLLSKVGMIPIEAVAGFYPNLQREEIRLPELIRYRDLISGEERQTTVETLMRDAIRLGIVMIGSAFQYHSGAIDREACEMQIRGQNLATGRLGKTKDNIRYSNR